MTTQARIDANRKNAQLSSGPRTEAGKQRSRLNALKHGLRSEEVVLPTEDRSEFDSHLAAWMDDWQPPTETRRFLVERAAVGAWRLKRCVRLEKARHSQRIDQARAEFDKAIANRVNTLARTLADHPKQAMAELHATRPGVLRLIEIWSELARSLDEPGDWTTFEDHHNILCNLLGLNGRDDSANDQRISEGSYRLVLHDNPELAEADDLSPWDDEDAESARVQLRAICRTEIEQQLPRRYHAMPAEPEARDQYADRKADEPQAEDTAHHRYEGRLDREVRATIGLLIKLQQTGIDLAAGNEPEPPSQPSEATVEAPTESKPATPAPIEPNAVSGQGLITKVDRDPKGTIGGVSGSVAVPAMVGIPLLDR